MTRTATARTFLLIFATLASPLHAQMPVVTCRATAYTNDPDTKGLNIRSAADAKSRVVATISDSDSQLDIVASSGDWMRVRTVRSVDGTVAFKGDGWVFASLLAVRARGVALLRTNPERTAPIKARLRDEDLLTLRACRGEWLQVKHQAALGWVEKSERCGNPVTTCS
ncbi:MAG: SH3 domain-containing protein [Gemmatimonadaceae bacterium]